MLGQTMNMQAINLQDVINIKNIIIYLLAINVITFFTMWLDKQKAKMGSWRIKESMLFTLVALGGGIGGIAGMYTFRHKTKKLYFTIGFPVILISEIIILIYVIIFLH